MPKAALWGAALVAALVAASIADAPARADEVSDKIDAARGANNHGDMMRTLASLQSAEAAVAARLVEQMGHVLPPPPAGWEATAPESEPLDEVGGGLTVTRGYQKGESVLNATVIVDNPSVANSVALFQGGTQGGDAGAGWKPVKVGTENAMLRFDASSKEGEIVVVVQSRAALQLEGSGVGSEQELLDIAQGWNVALLKKLLGQ